MSDFSVLASAESVEKLATALWKRDYPNGGSIYPTYESTQEHDKELYRADATPFLIGDQAALYRGDCLSIIPHLPEVDMVLADPPYGTTQNKWDSVIPLDEMWSRLRGATNDNTPIVMTSAQPFTSVLACSSHDFRYSWVWQKTQAVGHLNAYRRPMNAHEDICVFYRKQPTYNPQLEDKPSKDIRPETPRTKLTGCYGPRS